ncbi:MAG: hypothetical protein JRI23_03650 [Deltaproteobacteria bacterium]|jgi:hypothetical protein|nr:hypothetical protein [Deltaproteobacteria bacterium]MBW2530611.1 hypothetical protein [Deltaproteobacteria bacterium]
MGQYDPTDSAPGEAAVISTGIERVLLRARDEPAFLAELEERRSDAARDAGIELSATEATMLDSIDPSAISQMVANLPAVDSASAEPLPDVLITGIRPDMPLATQGMRPDVPGQSPFDPVRGTRTGVKVAVAAGVVLAAGAGALLCVSAGARPDVPPPAAGSNPEPRGAGEDGADPDGE